MTPRTPNRSGGRLPAAKVAERHAYVRRRLNEGASAAEIARELKLSAKTIQNFVRYHRLERNMTAAERKKIEQRKPARPQTVKRPCMCCKRPFPSEGAHNRLCDPCRREQSPLPAYPLVGATWR